MITINIPGEVYTMEDKRSIIKSNASLYREVSKKEKKEMLDDLQKVAHLHRKYIITLLNRTGKVYYTPQGVKLVGDPTITYLHKRGRKKKYTAELIPYLKALWVLSHYRSSLHLKAFIITNQDWLLSGIPKQTLDEFPKEERIDLQPLQQIPPPIQEFLKTISAATIERLLKPSKEQYRLKHRYRPHPRASVLKRQIPVEPHYNKVRGRIGYMEEDTVFLCGDKSGSNHCLALGDVEINTDWSEYRALRNRAHIWVERALTDIDKTVPFQVHTRHPDGGAEFINMVVMKYAQSQSIRYVRSRAYHKNDNPAVESRHFVMVRAYIGYRRYDTDAEYEILKELLPLISMLHNYFIPTMMLVRKVRVGGKVYKRYEIDTPYNRVLNATDVSEEKKQELRERKASLSYPELLLKILKLTKKLDQAYRNKYNSNLWDDNE